MINGDEITSPPPMAQEERIEVVVLAVTDPDRSRDFYAELGWRLDADTGPDADFRLVQLTPPGSGCSIQFGTNVTNATPGSAQHLYLAVGDIDIARETIVRGGAVPSNIFHEGAVGARFRNVGRLAGPAPDRATAASFLTFSDPDGNSWLVQELRSRKPGR